MARRLTVLLFVLLVIRKESRVMESSRPGKNSALAVALAVLLFVFDLQPYGYILLIIGLLITAYSSWMYMRRYSKRNQESDSSS